MDFDLHYIEFDSTRSKVQKVKKNHLNNNAELPNVSERFAFLTLNDYFFSSYESNNNNLFMCWSESCLF